MTVSHTLHQSDLPPGRHAGLQRLAPGGYETPLWRDSRRLHGIFDALPAATDPQWSNASQAGRRTTTPGGRGATVAIELPVVFADSEEASLQLITAHSTHDGYLLAAIPIGASRYSAALQFGALFEWFELDGLSFHPLKKFRSLTPEELRREVPAESVLESIERATPRLLRCENEGSFVMVHPPRNAKDEPLVLACLFRPVMGSTIAKLEHNRPANNLAVFDWHGGKAERCAA